MARLLERTLLALGYTLLVGLPVAMLAASIAPTLLNR